MGKARHTPHAKQAVRTWVLQQACEQHTSAPAATGCLQGGEAPLAADRLCCAQLLPSRSASLAKGEAHGLLLFCLVVCNAGLLLVDHIHFQYNGLLIGVLLWSLHLMQRGSDWSAGALFAVLLGMKHLFLFCSPVYFAHILGHWCTGSTPRACARFGLMATTVVAILGVAAGPFVYMGQAVQLARRLFPFGRGLTHAYWAANFWALYCGADRLLGAAMPRWARQPSSAAGMVDAASGVVGVARLRVLPMVPPWACALLVLAALLPAAVRAWARPEPRRFPYVVAYSCLCGFWLGYHVHEKAVLPVLLCLVIPAVHDPTAAQDFLVLSAAALYGLLPLLFRPQEYLVKLLLLLCYFLPAWWGLQALHGSAQGTARSSCVAAADRSSRAHASNGEGSARAQPVGQGPHGVGPAELLGRHGPARGEGSGQEAGVKREHASFRKGGRLGERQGAPGSKDPGAGLQGGETAVSTSLPHNSSEQHQGETRGVGGLACGARKGLACKLVPPVAGVYIGGFVLLESYCSLLHPALLNGRLPFLPLMLTSMYCAGGVGWVWVRMLLRVLAGDGTSC